MQTYLVYIGVLILAFCFAKTAEVTKKVPYVYVTFLTLALVSGLRGVTVGLDTPGYIEAFQNIAAGRLDLAYGLEWSFRYICYALTFIVKEPQLILLLFALISNGLIVWRLWELREYISFSASVAAYYVMFYMMSLNLMRQFIAMSIVFYATRYLFRGKNIRFLIFVVVAALFHQSALISILFIYFNITTWKFLTRNQKSFLIVIGAISPLIVAIVYQNLLQYSSYFNELTFGMGLLIIAKFCLLVFSLFALDRTEPMCCTPQGEKVRRIAVCSYITALLLTSLGYAWRFVDRIGLVFYIFESVYIGYIFKQKNTKKNFLIKVAVFALFAYLLVGNVRGNGQGQNPYLFFWQ